MVSSEKENGHGGGANFIEVVVLTTSGSYPEQGADQVNANQKVDVILKKAATALDLTDTSGWLVRDGDQPVNPDASFAAQGLHGTVELDWGPEEGGGGA